MRCEYISEIGVSAGSENGRPSGSRLAGLTFWPTGPPHLLTRWPSTSASGPATGILSSEGPPRGAARQSVLSLLWLTEALRTHSQHLSGAGGHTIPTHSQQEPECFLSGTPSVLNLRHSAQGWSKAKMSNFVLHPPPWTPLFSPNRVSSLNTI